MGLYVAATRRRRWQVAVFPVSFDREIIVRDDSELLIDTDYAEGVAEALTEAWDNNDYFEVEYVAVGLTSSRVLDSVHSMAGYGGPIAAACAAVRDHFSLSESELREFNRRVGGCNNSYDHAKATGRGVKVTGLDGLRGDGGHGLPAWIRRPR